MGKKLKEFGFRECGLGPQEVKASGGLLERGGLPSLRCLFFWEEDEIRSEGVGYLLKSIKKAGRCLSSPLLLNELMLCEVGVKD